MILVIINDKIILVTVDTVMTLNYSSYDCIATKRVDH